MSLSDLGRWVRTGWPAEHAVDTPMHRAFHDHIIASGRRGLTLSVVVLVIANLVFWLEDPWAFRDFPHLIGILSQGRAAITVLGLVVLGLAWLRPAQIYMIGITAGMLSIAIVAWTLGRCGGPESPWPYFILPFSLLSIGAWAQPWVRGVGMTALGLLHCAVFLWVRPDFATSPMASVAAGFLAFVMGLCLVLGVVADDVRVRSFIAAFQRDQERDRLAVRVREQTEAVVALSRRLDVVRQVERVSIARDLHDDLGQTLTATRMAAKLATDRYKKDPLTIAANLELIQSSLKQMSDQTALLLRSVRSAIVDERSLNGALDALVRRTADIAQVRADYVGVDTSGRCSTDVSIAVWRCAQEALTNVVRHADCRAVRVHLAIEGDDVVLTVDDDGVGFDPLAPTDRLGLVGLRERAEALGGAVHVASEPGSTRLQVRIPRMAEA